MSNFFKRSEDGKTVVERADLEGKEVVGKFTDSKGNVVHVYDNPTSTEAVKHDGGKPQLTFLHPAALAEIARVMEFGAKKYARNNWLKGMGWLRLADAALRHLMAWSWGEDKDPESGLSHLAHAGCCIMFALAYEQLKLGTDDRKVL